jgi:hypothetical protein
MHKPVKPAVGYVEWLSARPAAATVCKPGADIKDQIGWTAGLRQNYDNRSRLEIRESVDSFKVCDFALIAAFPPILLQ